MSKTLQIIIGIIIIIVIVVLVVVFSGEKGEKETIKIGVILPLTGEAASAGENSLAGIVLAVKEVNDKGGILGRKIELIIEDDKCSSEGVNAMNKLINIDKVVAVLGPACSASGGPALPIVQENKIPAVITASAPHLTKIGDYIFRVYPSDTFQGEFAAEYIFNELEKKKVAVIYVKNDWGQGLRDVFVQKFKELGGEIISDDAVTQETKDFRTQLTKIKSSEAEILYFPVYPANGIAAFKQIKELGFDIPVIGADSFSWEEVIKSDYGDGILFTLAKFDTPEDFKSKINSLSGYENLEVMYAAPLYYDAAKVMLEAIEKAGKLDKQSIRDALARTSYKGVSLPLIEFDDNGDIKTAVYEVQIIRDKKSETYEK